LGIVSIVCVTTPAFARSMHTTEDELKQFTASEAGTSAVREMLARVDRGPLPLSCQSSSHAWL
jgi:predicted aconitase